MTASLSLPQLHHRFRAEPAFRANAPYRLLPFRFTDLDRDRTVLTNLVGEHLVVAKAQVPDIVHGRVARHSSLYAELVSRHFILDATSTSGLDLLAIKYRTKYAAVSSFTALHMFVVTLRCDHSCPYCQVSRVSSDRAAFDMTETTADRAVELAFMSPNPNLKIEFQGGESLLNFSLIRHITESAERLNARDGKNLQFVVATNLSPLTVDMLAFMKDHRILVSTSLDGPRELHNANRPRPGNDSYERAIDGIRRCRETLGPDSVSALMTTTLRSLTQPEAIVDEYVRQGFTSIFLRWLSPYGFAAKTSAAIGYDPSEYLRFYERGLRYILDLNRAGMPMREEYAAIVLRKMLTPYASGYVDLQSPAGLGCAAVAFNYDGHVYASDEGRMLAEHADTTFSLGNVHTHSYRELFLSDRLVSMLYDTMTEAIPGCTDCAFEPWCGTEPVFHHATQGDMVGYRPTSGFCNRNMEVFRLLVRILEDEPDSAPILRRWARGAL